MTVSFGSPKRHVLTVNLEDYYQVGAFNRFIQRNRWQRFESRIETSSDRTLEVLAKHGATATFFVLGWVAEQFPDAIRRIADAGHEVGVRGFFHRGIRDMTRDEFVADTVRARAAVEAASGTHAIGYRLADGWLGADDLWALDALAELGFVYDSSIAPIRRAFSDEPTRLVPHEHQNGTRSLIELPVSCGKILGVRVPVAGGNYLRQLPRFLTRRAAAKWDRIRPTPIIAYFHTWELDTDQPRITAVGRITNMRHYRNLARMPARIAEVLSSYTFVSCRDYLQKPAEPAPSRTGFVPLALDTSETSRMETPTPIGPSIARTAVTVVVPVYNEELILPHLQKTLDDVRQQLSQQYEVTFLLVDDGSNDRTWSGLVSTFGHRPGYQLLKHDVNLGVAAAIMTGIRGSNTEIVCSMDCDCSYDPMKLTELIPLLVPGVDLVTASPYHPAGAVRNVPGWRLVLSKGAAWMYRRALRTRLYTYTSCFRVYRRSVVASIYLSHNRFLGVAELIGRLDLMGKKVVEHPAVLEVRMIGRSKMKTVRTVIGHLGLLSRLMYARVRKLWSKVDRDDVIRSQISMIRKITTVNTSVNTDTPARGLTTAKHTVTHSDRP